MRVAAMGTFEVRQQLRDPLTALYALVFFLLALGHTSSSVVELVNDRGLVPKTSPWALSLAFGGLAAFGQVITTMISATAMLRDDALRTRDLVATSGVSARQWFTGHALAAIIVMLLVYAAMPLGAFVGALWGAVVPIDAVAFGEIARATLRAFIIITVPTSIVVALLLTAVAVRWRQVMSVLVAALTLVALWQLALTLEQREPTRLIGALLDPFGNAPVLAQTRDWSTADRMTRTLELRGVLLWNRILWLLLAGTSALIASARVSWTYRTLSALRPQPDDRAAIFPAWFTSPFTAPFTSPFTALRQFTTGWIVGDPAWKIVASLAIANALLNALVQQVPDADGSMAVLSRLVTVQSHARVFLILLATVYAGEIIWRDRDLRVSDVVDVMPMSARTTALARVSGLLTAQSWLALALAAGGLLVSRPWSVDGASCWFAWSLFVLWLPFLQLTVLSVAVHAIVNHKVLAHLAIITGWVLAVIINRQLMTPWWIRFAEPAPWATQTNTPPWGLLAQRGAYWSAVSAALVFIVVRRWPRRTARSTSRR